MTYNNILVDQFSGDLLEERRFCLQLFMNKVLSHQILKDDSNLSAFLYDNEIVKYIKQKFESLKKNTE